MSSFVVGKAKGRSVSEGRRIVFGGRSSSSPPGVLIGCGVADRGVADRGVEGFGVEGFVGVDGGGELVARAAAGSDARALAFRRASSCSASICLNKSLNFFVSVCSPTSAR
jgi:hypothetical protein